MKKSRNTKDYEYSGENSRFTPLMHRMRPKSIADVLGQEKVLRKEGIIGRMVEAGKLSSLILWGHPGTGKTSIGLLLARHFSLRLEYISAVFSSVSELKGIFAAARRLQKEENVATCLFVDEIHRFNKAQQDGFLPYVEDGTIILIGATTENPSFSLRSALLSRARVVVLEPLNEAAMRSLLQRTLLALEKELHFSEEAEAFLIQRADGDARRFIMSVELISLTQPKSGGKALTLQEIRSYIDRQNLLYDSGGDEHYNLISALHKTLRGSDADAALYYLLRMLLSGEDPGYIARRMLRFAYEDVGLADPQAAVLALNAWQSYERLGSPEGEIALASAAIYLAYAPKSNSSYKALNAAGSAAKKYGSLSPPKTILNAPTKLMKNLDYSKGYRYDHETRHGFSGQEYFPESMPRLEFYTPIERGFEREISKRKSYFEKLKKRVGSTKASDIGK